MLLLISTQREFAFLLFSIKICRLLRKTKTNLQNLRYPVDFPLKKKNKIIQR